MYNKPLSSLQRLWLEQSLTQQCQRGAKCQRNSKLCRQNIWAVSSMTKDQCTNITLRRTYFSAPPQRNNVCTALHLFGVIIVPPLKATLVCRLRSLTMPFHTASSVPMKRRWSSGSTSSASSASTPYTRSTTTPGSSNSTRSALSTCSSSSSSPSMHPVCGNLPILHDFQLYPSSASTSRSNSVVGKPDTSFSMKAQWIAYDDARGGYAAPSLYSGSTASSPSLSRRTSLTDLSYQDIAGSRLKKQRRATLHFPTGAVSRFVTHDRRNST